MKKLIALILSTLIIVSFFAVSANAITYVMDSVGAYANLNFFVDNTKSENLVFKKLTLKIKWRNLLEREKNINNIATTNIEDANVESEIIEKNKYCDCHFSGETTLSFESEKGVDLSNKRTILSLKVNRNAGEVFVDYYVEGEFIGADGVDYAKKDIIKTNVTLDKTDKVGEPFFCFLNVNNIGETEDPKEPPSSIAVRETEETETTDYIPLTTATVQPTTETVEQTTSATEQEPTEPKETVKKTTAKKKNPIKVTVKTKTVKAKKLKKGKVSVKAITVKKAKGEVKYSKVSGSKKLTINKTTGKIKIKKGTKKGNYTIKVKVTAKGTKNYKPKTITKKVKIKVK